MPFLKSIISDIIQFYETHSSGVVILWGTTATGKTEVSLELANHLPLEIISADSRQIFRYMDIGTDKVPKEYREKIPHYQIDIVNPDQLYTAGEWQADVEKIIPHILKREKIPLIVGGTGLYIDMIYKNFQIPKNEPNWEWRQEMYEKEKQTPGFLYEKLKEVDPISAQHIHPHATRYIIRALEIYYQTGKPKSQIVTSDEPKRPLLMLGLRREKKTNELAIKTRIEKMLARGLIDEVQRLLDQGYSPELQSMQGIGYKQTIAYLQKHHDRDRLFYELVSATCRYAKRQRTRLRKYIRDSMQNPRNKVTYKVYHIE